MAKTVKKNAGRYSRRKTKKRSAAAYKRITGTPYKRKTVKRSSRSKQVKRNPAPTLRKITKSTGWMAGPPGTGTQVKFKNNKGKREVYIRRKPRAKKGKR